MHPDQFVQIQPSSTTPIFRQIVEQVTRKVIGGSLLAGEEIPSVRVMAASLGVHAATVSKAYSILEHDGVVVRRRGKSLVIADHQRGMTLPADREALLRPILQKVVAETRQLGLSNDDAMSLFKSLIAP